MVLTYLSRFVSAKLVGRDANQRRKEMEAAAIAWVCQLHNQNFTAIKTITDIVDGEHCTSEEFLQNFEMASHALKENVIQVLDFLLKA